MSKPKRAGRNSQAIPPPASDNPLENFLLSLSTSGQYNQVSQSLLISLAPPANKVVPNDFLSKEYAQHHTGMRITANLDIDLLPNPPHVFTTVQSAYSHLLIDKSDQSIVLAGEAGSGKSISHSLVIR
jgi:hypothetical protein